MNFVVLVPLILSAPDPGFTARIHSPQQRATQLQHFDVWSDQALKVCRILLGGSEVDSNNLFVDNPSQKRYGIQRNYRQSVSREHLVVTFYGSPANNVINTKHGELALLEIVIGLTRKEHSNRYILDKIFSVDEEGRIHQHLQPDGGKREVFNEFVGRIIQAKSQQ